MVNVSGTVGSLSVNVTVPMIYPKNNILLVYFDDMGVEQCRKYDSIWGSAGYVSSKTETDLFNLGIYANTPNLDAFHNTSVQFIHAHSQPVCSPTRAGIYSGRYGFRTGIGALVGTDRATGGVGNKCHTFGVDVATPTSGNYVNRREYTIAEIARAAGYKSGFFGKWHLGLWKADSSTDAKNTDESGALPNGTVYTSTGWDHIDTVGQWDDWWAVFRNPSSKPQPYNGNTPDGTYGVQNGQGQNGGYYARAKGDTTTTLYNGSANYLEKLKIQRALAWMNDPANQPFICVVAFHLPHAPFHDPTQAGYTVRSVYTALMNDADSAIRSWAYYGGMREAADVEFGNLMNGMNAQIKAQTDIFVTADNGTEQGITQGAYNQTDGKGDATMGEFSNLLTGRAKGTIFNLGSWVPLYVSGPSVKTGSGFTIPRTSSLPVDIHVDLFETFRNLMHVNYSSVAGNQTRDGVSIVPALANGNHGIDAHTKKHCHVEYFKPMGDPDDVEDQGLAAGEFRDERAYLRYIRTVDGYTGTAAGLYKFIRALNTTTGVREDSFYRIGTSAGSPSSSDWDEQTNLINDLTYAGQLAIVQAEAEALWAQS